MGRPEGLGIHGECPTRYRGYRFSDVGGGLRVGHLVQLAGDQRATCPTREKYVISTACLTQGQRLCHLRFSEHSVVRGGSG